MTSHDKHVPTPCGPGPSPASSAAPWPASACNALALFAAAQIQPAAPALPAGRPGRHQRTTEDRHRGRPDHHRGGRDAPRRLPGADAETRRTAGRLHPPRVRPRAQRPQATPRAESATGHDRLRLAVAVYKTGTFTLPPLSLTVTAPDGKEFPATTPEVSVTIQSVLTDKDTALKGLKNQAEIEEPFPWRTWLAAPRRCCWAASLAWWLLRRRRRLRRLSGARRQPQLSPLEIAEVELRDLAARGLVEKGHDEAVLREPLRHPAHDTRRRFLGDDRREDDDGNRRGPARQAPARSRTTRGCPPSRPS